MKNKFIIFVLIVSLYSQGNVSKSGAFWRSIVLPGWGNYYAGNYNAAIWHLGAELSLWTGYFYHDYKVDESISRYKRFAKSNLTLSFNDYPSGFYREIAKYNTYEQYRLYQLGLGKNPESLLPEQYAWFWPNDKLRREYAEQRSDAIGSERKIRLWFYAMFANRLLAWITSTADVRTANALRVKSKASYNKIEGNKFSFNIAYEF